MFLESKNISQDRTTHNPESLLKTMVYHYEITMGNSIRGKTLQDAERKDIFEALALSLRDQIISHWSKTVKKLESGKHKQTFYFSLEFLIGRSFSQNVMNLHLTETVNAVLKPFDLNINDLENLENEAGLGNGG
jgi:starch phosphorylase